jgi:hypothetical protein
MVAMLRSVYTLALIGLLRLIAHAYFVHRGVFTWPLPDARFCEFTGFHFCGRCHGAAVAVLPSRVVHEWSFQPRSVNTLSTSLLFITPFSLVDSSFRHHGSHRVDLQEGRRVSRLHPQAGPTPLPLSTNHLHFFLLHFSLSCQPLHGLLFSSQPILGTRSFAPELPVLVPELAEAM